MAEQTACQEELHARAKEVIVMAQWWIKRQIKTTWDLNYKGFDDVDDFANAVYLKACQSAANWEEWPCKFSTMIANTCFYTWVDDRTSGREVKWNSSKREHKPGYHSPQRHPFERVDDAEEVSAIVAGAGLTEREWVIVTERTLGEKTLRELAMRLGVSHQRIRQIQHAATQKLAKSAKELGLGDFAS